MGVKINQLPSGRFNAKVFDYTDANGKRHYKSITADSKSEVKKQIAVFLANREYSSGKENMTLGEAMGRYIEKKRNILSDSTIYGYEKIMKNNIQNLQKMKISKITSAVVMDSLQKDAETLSVKSLKNIYGLAKTVLSENDIYVKLQFPQTVKKVRVLPEPSVIFNAVKGTNIELPVLLAMWLSLRMSEVLGLRYGDVRDGHLIVHSVVIQINKERIIDADRTKTTNSTRVLKIPPYIMQLIGSGKSEDHIVTLPSYSISQRFSRILNKNNIPHITFHDLRHINASVMLRLGISDKIAMERGGWASTGVLKQVYQESFMGDRENADSIIDNYFETMIEKA